MPSTVLAQPGSWDPGVGGNPINQSVADGGTVILTMDDLPSQPLDGLVHPNGVTFAYDGPDVATYNATGPGILTYVQDPSIEGGVVGRVSMVFEQPTPTLSFGVARTSQEDVLVTLYDVADSAFQATWVTPERILAVPEALFSHEGTSVSRAEVAFFFSDSTNLGRFAIDNLTFVVPEPSGLLMTVLGLATLVGLSRSRGGNKSAICAFRHSTHGAARLSDHEPGQINCETAG